MATRYHHRFFLPILLFLATLASALPRTSSPTPQETALPAATPPPPPVAQTTPPSTAPQTALGALPTTAYRINAAAGQPGVFRPEDGPPDYDVLIPADPDAAPRPTADLAEHGLMQITYYSCATFAATTHCGWHRPLVPVSSASPSKPDVRLVAAAWLCAFALLAVLS